MSLSSAPPLADSPVLVRLFGPARVAHSETGVVRDLGSIPRRVLVQLVLAGGLGSPADTVIANTWPDPPASATQSLRNHVAALRRHLGPAGRDHLVHQTSGYVLGLDRAAIDVLRFEDTVTDALDTLRTANSPTEVNREVRAALEAGLALWVGPPFAGVEDHPLVEGLPVFLAGRHSDGSLALASLQIEDGDHPDAEETLHDARRVDPWDQRLLRMQMTLMEQLDRRPAAIRLFEDFADQLKQQLGAAPEEASRQMYARLLDYSPDSPPRSPDQNGGGPMRPATLVGRHAEIETAQQFLGSSRRMLTITGRSGTGRTTMLDHLASIATHRIGRLVHVQVRPRVGDAAEDVVALLLAETERHDDDLDISLRTEDEAAEPRDLLARWFALQQNTLVVIDDLHHADGASVAGLAHALRHSQRSGTQVVVTHDVGWRGLGADEWNDLEADMASDSDVEPIAIEPFGVAAIDELAVRETGGPLHPHVLAVVEEDSGGLPRLALEMIRLRYHGAGPVPELIHRIVGAQLRHLSSQARSVLDVLAVMGARPNLSGLTDIVEMREAVVELADQHLILEDPSSHRTQVAFVAPIVGRSVYEKMGSGRRNEIHVQLAEEFSSNPARVRDAAHHALAAEEAMLPQDVLRIVNDAATSAGERKEVAEATALYLSALRLHRLVYPRDQRGFMRLFVDLFRCVDDVAGPEIDAAWSVAMAGARQERDASLVLTLAESRLDRPIGANEEFIDLLEDAVSWCGPDDSGIRIGLQARAATEVSESHPWPRGFDLAKQSHEAARVHGDPALLGAAIRAVLANSFRSMGAVERSQLAVEFTNLARMVANPDYEMLGLTYELFERVAAGERQTLWPMLDDIERTTRERNRPRYTAFVLSTRASLALAQGRVEEADAHIEGLKEQSELSRNRDVAYAVMAYPVLKAWTLGDMETVLPFLDATWDEATGELFHRLLLAGSHAAARTPANLDAARTLLAPVGFANLPSGILFPGYVATAVDAVVALGDLATAEVLLHHLEPFAGRHLLYGGGLGLLGPAEGFSAELAFALGRRDESQRLFGRAVGLAADVGDILIVERLRSRQVLLHG